MTANEFLHLSMGTQVARGQPQKRGSEEYEGKIKPQKEERRSEKAQVT